MQNDLSPIKGIYFSFVRASGIKHRLASTVRRLDKEGSTQAKSQGHPLILFLHGFPESWYSWRHQLLAFRDQAVLAVAPDMRGYGCASQRRPIEDYTQPALVRNILVIAEQLGYTEFVLVGHDWGATLAWSVSLLYPQNVLGVCGMSVPYAGLGKTGLLTMLQNKFGKCLDPSLPREVIEKTRFHYILHHCLPRCEEEYDKDVEDVLYRMYGYRKGCRIQPGTPENDANGLMFPSTGNDEFDRARILDATAAPGWWKRVPRPVDLPQWFTQKDLDYIVQEYKRSGFLGGLSWYRAADRSFEFMKHLSKSENGGHGEKIKVPSVFIMGENDALVELYGGKTKIENRLREYLPGMIGDPTFVSDCGHWIQQEAALLVNNVLVEFLECVTKIRGFQRPPDSRL